MMPSRIASNLRLLCWSGSYTLNEGVPPMKRLKGMTGEEIEYSLEQSAIGDVHETTITCCKILKKPRKLSEQQIRTILESMLSITTSKKLTVCCVLEVAVTIDMFINNSKLIRLKKSAFMLEISLAWWIPDIVSFNIMKHFKTGIIHHCAVAWALKELAELHAPRIKPHMEFILGSLVDVMEGVKDQRTQFWLCRAFACLADLFEISADDYLIKHFILGFYTCKGYYVENAPHNTVHDNEINVEVIITLGTLAPVLTIEDLDEEILWVTKELRILQQRLPVTMSFQLIKPLVHIIKVVTTKGCGELKPNLPALLSALHRPISWSGRSRLKEEARIVSTSGFAFLVRSHPNEVHTFIRNCLDQEEMHQRVGTLQLLHDLLTGSEFLVSEKPFYKESMLQVLQDDNKKVVLAVLVLLSDLTARGCYDERDKAVIDYLEKQSSRSAKPEETGDNEEDEEDEDEIAIREKSIALLQEITSIKS
ncbi:maestro heat-like repeat-containing protein family member 1 [Ambystoma mexicanum]|uniref:maestro heat-like repeat-containing protein family member 1 n=1 Tax=Ambystoma mexicanum TaxID=8296 RepID=UPI0037E927C5